MKRSLLATTIALGFALACTGTEVSIEDNPIEVEDATPEQRAADVAKAVAADEAKVDEALTAAGMTEAEYETLMYDIAMDPARSKEFLSARGE